MELSAVKRSMELIEKRDRILSEFVLLSGENRKIQIFVPDPLSMDGNGSHTTITQLTPGDLLDILIKKQADVEAELKAAGVEINE
jgi:hypothetical protein